MNRGKKATTAGRAADETPHAELVGEFHDQGVAVGPPPLEGIHSPCPPGAAAV